MWLLNKSQSKTSSRNQIAIKEVKDDILVLPKNQYRVILETSSINFELKSEAEQDVLIENYQSFLNSLPGPIQIVIRTRKMDIDQYLAGIQTSHDQESAPIYKQQIKNYQEFVQSLVRSNKILTRKFYLIIPHHASGLDEFELIKQQLKVSTDVITKGLERLGMKSRQLSTLEILNVFYSFYNPNQFKIQELNEKSLQTLFH